MHYYSRIQHKLVNRFFIIAIATLPACGGIKSSLQLDLKEKRPGVLPGYLQFTELPNSIVLIPPAPKEGTSKYLHDVEINKTSLEKKDPDRWKQAQRDAILHFPEAIEDFAKIIDISINDSTTPNLTILLRRTLTDASLSTYAAKKQYMRKRPFMINKMPTCTPEDEEHLNDGSYPSGHAAIGWAWALILTEIVPEKTNQILHKGREIGQSRAICNVHWQSDVDAGQTMGAATVARLRANPTFLKDLEKAKKEVHFNRK